MKTVAIVGSHQDTRADAPWDDPSIDIWLFNEAGQATWAKRATAIFQMHDPAVYMNPFNRCDPNHWSWLQEQHPFKIYLARLDANVPAAEIYPIGELLATMNCEKRMMTCTAAYALALAAFLKYDKVLLYGIEVDFEGEYRDQREAVTYWVGFLQGQGITVDRHCADGLFTHPLYGRESLWEQKPEDYAIKLSHYETEIRKLARAHKKAATAADRNASLVTLHIMIGRQAERQRYYDKVKAMIALTGRAILDRTELERAAKDLIPQIEQWRILQNQAIGARNERSWEAATKNASQLAGRWKENKAMVKEAEEFYDRQ